MNGKKDIRTIRESETGRNLEFKVPGHGQMTRPALVAAINAGKFGGYHVRVINGVPTPVSNPDKSSGNNLD